MGSHEAEKIVMEAAADGSETTIEIKIKTLDSQTHTLRVNKQMPVPALKEQIASVTGVLSEQQRLICRGKVLKDDQLLSAYHVEDGHTLHMVVRQPIPPSAESGFNHSALHASLEADPTSGSSRTRVSPNVVIETFSMPDQGEGVPPEIGRIVSAILGSFGFPNVSGGSNGTDVGEHGSQRSERTGGAGLVTDSSQRQPGLASAGSQTDRPQSAFGIPSAVSLEPLQPPVLPDSFTTLSQYLNRLKQDFESLFRGEVNDPLAALGRDGNREPTSASNSATAQERLPTLASLAELLLSARLLLVEQVGDRVNQLARQLLDQGNVTEAVARAGIQSNTWRTGVLLHNLGSLLLELGRTTMTARLGQAPTEAVVNAGPAVFISPTGPNPIMVQPLPLQPGGFGAIPVMSAQPSAGLINGLGSTFLPRRIDIQIRRAMPNANREEGGDTQQPAGQRASTAAGSTGQDSTSQTTFGVPESTVPGEPGVRVVPIRTVVATIPTPFSRQSSDSQINNRGSHYPVLVSSQHVASDHMNINQAVNESVFDGIQSELPPVPEVSAQQQNPEGNARDGPSLNPNSRQQRPTRSISINVLTASGMPTNQESERQMPNSFLQLLRTVFPGAELTTEETNPEQLATQPAPEVVGASRGTTPGSGVTEEGMFLSNLLTQIMPVISQHSTSGQDGVISQEASVSVQAENSAAGTSRRPDDSETSPPNSKRQKTD